MNTPAKEGLAAAVAAVLSVWTAQSNAAVDLTGAYIGASGGQATVEMNGHQNGQNIDVSDDDTGYKIFAGYMFTEHFGLEVGYVDFGNQKDSFGYDGGEGIFNVNVNANASGNTLQLVGAYPLGPVDVFAKVGGISFNGNVSANGSDNFGNTIRAKTDLNSTDPVYGLGLKYNIGKFSLRAEGELYDVSDASDVYLLSAGAQFNF